MDELEKDEFIRNRIIWFLNLRKCPVCLSKMSEKGEGDFCCEQCGLEIEQVDMFGGYDIFEYLKNLLKDKMEAVMFLEAVEKL